MVEWMFYNGESIDFLKSLQSKGRTTALDDYPELSEDGKELWEVYCFMGDNVLVGVDLYDRRIGLPEDWEFKECVLLVAAMQAKWRELKKVSKNDG